MKDTKVSAKRILIPAALVILILLLCICIANCGKQAEDMPAPELTEAPTESAPAVTTLPQTEPAEETTIAVEETTEATEETVAATTAPTTDTDTTDSTEEEDDYVDVPDPGSPENPYVEVISAYPGSVESVNISAGTEVSYLITGAAGSVITIEGAGVSLTVDGKTYTADEVTDILTVDLSKLGVDPMIQLTNATAVTSSCVVNLSEGIGGAGNPEILTDPAQIPVALPEGDANGYHYKWTATVDGKVELTLKEAEAEIPEETVEETGEPEETETTEPTETEPAEEEAVLEIVVTIGEESFRLSAAEDGVLSFDVKDNEEILIQVIAVPWTDGTYPEIEETVLFNLLPALGTVENPQVLETMDTIALTLEAGDDNGWHYLWTADRDGQLTLTPPAGVELTATLEETMYTPAEEETSLSFHVTEGQQVLLQAIAAPEGEEGQQTRPAVSDGTITGTLVPDPGAPENPVVLESVESITVSLTEGDKDGYTCVWTAQLEGTLTLQEESNEANLEAVLTGDDGTVSRLSESTDGTLTLETLAGDTVTLLVTAVADDSGTLGAGALTLKGSFEAVPGNTEENPIQLGELPSATTVAMEARQTLYFSGMVQEMIATVEDANGVSIHYDGKTAWGSQTGVATMEFPEADEAAAEEPVVFSVTSKNEKELTLVFAYPEGHAKNPAELILGENKIQLKENDTDGYLFAWTADCDGLLTVAMEKTGRWQYQIDNLTTGAAGQLFTSAQETVTAEQTVEVNNGDQIQITVKTLDPSDPEAVPAGNLKVMASFFDPLLGTQAKPIRLDSDQNTVNTVTVPAGQSLYYSAEAEGMILTLDGKNVTVSHNGTEHIPENGNLELHCHSGSTVLVITNSSGKDEICKLSFAYPEGHKKNPLDLVLGENTAVLTDCNLSGVAFAWTAESGGQLTITMPEDTNWQFVVCNETTGTDCVVHTSQDEPKEASEMIEVTAGDRILVVVNSFDPEHPLHTPAAEVVFTAEFVDPTLGMEENPVWLNQTDEITIPAGKTMYCTAKADGMLLTLLGSDVKVSHNGVEHLPEQDQITFLCQGAGTFEHPVFVITNTGSDEGVYSICFTYPEGHFMNPAELSLGENTAAPDPDSRYGYYYLWSADLDGTLTVTMETENGWAYSVANLTDGVVGSTHLSTDEEPVHSETIEVSKGDQIRIIISGNSDDEAGAVIDGIRFRVSTAAAEPAEQEQSIEEPA